MHHGIEGQPSVPEIHLDIEMTNTLQMMLMEESGEDPERWIEKNGALFRAVIEDDPRHYAELYHNDMAECMREMQLHMRRRTLH